ncbi:MAG: serine--tRNA ligase [Verrucomicrobiota bacterium]|nr:serine--tRNA ligase [Verrucomicrobiota bacterium]
MLDMKRIRENPDAIREGIKARGQPADLVDELVAFDRDRRTLLTEVERLKNERNTVSLEIGARKKQGEDTSAAQAAMRQLGSRIAALDARVRDLDEQLQAKIIVIPNMPHSSAPVGPGESANVTVRSWGAPREFEFEPKGHTELGEALGILDLARASKMSGAGFPLFVGLGARLERALINFMLDLHVREHDYIEVWPPVLCHSPSMTGTGQLPKLATDMYRLADEDLWLIPTAEVPVTNYFRDEIIEQPLPIYLTAYSVCFRKEAGAAGRETRGIIRVHQFDKVEMVKFVEPGTSCDELESLTRNAEDVLQRLGLVYRVRMLGAGDLSFAAAKCYDLELWAPGKKAWLEVSSCSNFEDFQARRAGIRFRDKKGKVRFVHTLNGSGVALPRLVVAILENGQQADGSVTLPPAIVPYMGGIDRIAPAGGLIR